ncbi:MAG: SRPBCC domain-containing protein [Saprospiraceae bacterium]
MANTTPSMNEPVIVEVTLNVPAEQVWTAITDRNQMQQWFFDLAEFRAEIGFEFRFPGGPSPEKQYMHVCKITAVEPGKILTYSWHYAGYQGETYVSFLLSPQGVKTLLRLTHTGLESFPADNPDFVRENFVEGWGEIIGSKLKMYLEQ